MLAVAGHKLEAKIAIMSKDSLTPGIVHRHCINKTINHNKLSEEVFVILTTQLRTKDDCSLFLN